MNRYILILVLLSGGWLAAQSSVTLHVVYNILDQPSDNVYIGCQKDLKGGESFFGDLGEVTEELGLDFRVEQHHIDFSRAGVETFLARFPARPNDAMIFIYSGHGISIGEPRTWPELAYCSDTDPLIDEAPEQCVMQLDAIHDLLRKTPLRMSLVIGSSCNQDGVEEQNNTLARLLHGSKVPANNANGTGAHANLELFTEYEGHILASASGPGQVAFLNDSIGSYYLAAFYDALEDGFVSEVPSSWGSILAETARRVRDVRKKNQDPQFQICKDDRVMVSYADREPYMEAIDPTEFAPEWELTERTNLCLELIGYLLVEDFLTKAADDEDNFDDYYDRLLIFYGDVILWPHHGNYRPGLENDLIDQVLSIYGEADYYELLGEARAHLDGLSPDLQGEIQTYLDGR